MYGKTEHSIPSRFWNEIPEEYVEDVSPQRKNIFEFVHEKTKKNIPAWNSQEAPKGKPSGGYRVGERVKHNVFGKGTVLKMEANKSATVLQIQFDTAGVKTILAEFAKLEKID